MKKKKSQPFRPGAVQTGRRGVFARVRRGIVGIVRDPIQGAPTPASLAKVEIVGTGFVVDAKKRIIATAGHVVDPWLRAIQAYSATNTGPE